MNMNSDIVVVGGGAVGLCTAWYLSEAGARVTVVDRMRVDEKASVGNAGMLVPSHVVPLSAPGVVMKGLKMMMSASSPFRIAPRADRAFLRWLWLFNRHANRRHMAYGVPLLRDLSLKSVDLFRELCALEGLSGAGFAQTGLLNLYRGEAAMRDDLALADVAERAGLEIDRLDEAGVRALEPDIRVPVNGGVFYRQDASIHPEKFVVALAGMLAARGVEFVDATAGGIDRSVGVVLDGAAADGRRAIGGDRIVVAAGAWTPSLVRSLGLRLPVEPARGYSVTVREHDTSIRIPCVFTDEKITITPMAGELRFTGTLTLTGFNREVQTRRAEPIRRLAQTYAGPSMAIEKPEMWSGFRPASPDGLPMIGLVPGTRNVYVATGHGMLGVTQAPVTGRMLSAMMGGPALDLDPEPYNPGRFG